MARCFRCWRRLSPIEIIIGFGLVWAFWFYISTSRSNGHEDDIEGFIQQQLRLQRRPKAPQDPLPCYNLPGANETVVVFRTTAAELEERLSVHLDTTILCYPNYLIFSDWDEKFKDHSVRDVLTSVSQSVRLSHPDFELWRRLQRGGPDALEDKELWHSAQTSKDIDKWKLLPIMTQTYVEYPDMKWYVFLETDTFIFWSNVLEWLHGLDSQKPYYLGASQELHDVAALGSGIILSHATLEKLVRLLSADKVKYERFTNKHASGDAILAKALGDVGVGLTTSWPTMQGDRPASMDFGKRVFGTRLWCYPAVSYRGVTPSSIVEMWKFEQQWLRDRSDDIIYHRDVFTDYVRPRLVIRSGRVDDWDNFSNSISLQKVVAESLDRCREICIGDKNCVQFSFSNETCAFSHLPKLGHFAPGSSAHWILPRLERWITEMPPCVGDETWPK